jgi:glutamate N-acetyltransferase/amino-acid N-acetyltransferase
MIPKGFLFSTVEATIKKPGRKDLSLIYSQVEAYMAGAFTTNKVKASPVKLDMRKIKSGKGRAVIVNSGNANACTGTKGMEDAVEMSELVASASSLNVLSSMSVQQGYRNTPAYGSDKTKDHELVNDLGGSSLRTS